MGARRGQRCHVSNPFHDIPDPGRRRFLQRISLGGGLASLAWMLPVTDLLAATPRPALATDVLLLSCMDYRLVEATGRYMAGRGLTGDYDHVVLAGAALGAVTETHPAWNQTFWEHLQVAIELHSIHRVILLDHRDCGAYRVILGEDLAGDPQRETEAHAVRLRRLGGQIRQRYPGLEVELLLMALDGGVEEIPVA